MRKTTIAAAVAFLSLAFAAGAAQSEPDTAEIAFDIPAQPLNQALNRFAQQADLRIVFDTSAAEGVAAPAVSGNLTAREALQMLLGASNLTYRFMDARTVAVDVPVKTSANAGAREASLRLAQTDQSNSPSSAEDSSESSPRGSDKNSESSDTKLDEIVVTAQRYEQKLEDVPIAISVFSGKELDMSSETSVNDTLLSVPGLTIDTQTVGGTSKISIRGISNLLGSATVGYYVDGVPFGFVAGDFSPDPGPFDLDRVEVLRGPQGTLYGANSLNGVVRVLTKDANLDDFELKGRALVSSIDGGGINRRADAVVNAPIISGKLAARLLVGYNHKGGYIDNLVADEIDDGSDTNIRLKINAQPTEDLSVKLGYWRSRADFGALSLSYIDRDFYPGELQGGNITNFDVYSGTVAYDFGSFTASNTAGYFDYLNQATADWSAFPNAFPIGLDGLLHLTQTSKAFTNELSLNSQSDSSWAWSAGAFYRDSTDDVRVRSTQFGVGTPSIAESTSNAIFGEVTRYFAGGALELSGGLRYFHDKVRQFEPGASYDVTSTFNHLSPRAVLNWHPNDQMTVYASYSQGFRSGLNQSAGTEAATPGLPPAREDKLNNYEIGSKGRLFDGFLSYEVAAYYIEWVDVKQALTLEVVAFPQPAYVNTGTARGPGVDVGLTFHPATRLNIGLTASWNDIQFDDVVFLGPDILYNKGDRPAGSTKYTLGGSIGYRAPLGGTGLEAGFSGSVDYKSASESVVLNNRTPGDAITDSRLALQIAKSGVWTFEVFCDNLLNERGAKSLDPFVPFYQNRFPPRTIGAQFFFQL